MLTVFNHVSLSKNKLMIRQLKSGSVGLEVAKYNGYEGTTTYVEFLVESPEQLDAIIRVLQAARKRK